MGYLVLSILSSTLILIIFKLFERYKINNLYAIISNYIVAGGLGYLLTKQKVALSEIIGSEWIWPAVGIGFLFIALFQVMAFTAQKIGVSRVSIAVKMSLALPVLAGVWLYNERLSIAVIIGIFLALTAVYLGTKKPVRKQASEQSWLLFILPLILFIGNGSIDVLMKYAQHYWLEPTELAMFSGVLFIVAFLWGIFFGIYHIIQKKIYPTVRDLIAGLLLGIPNFGSIYFLLQALDKSNMPSAAIYPINNVAIVGLSAVAGVVIFKEHLSRINIIGLISAICAILLIAYG